MSNPIHRLSQLEHVVFISRYYNNNLSDLCVSADYMYAYFHGGVFLHH